MFDSVAEKQVQNEWGTGTSLWLLKKQKYILSFLAMFASEFGKQQGIIKGPTVTLVDSPDSRFGKNAQIFFSEAKH